MSALRIFFITAFPSAPGCLLGVCIASFVAGTQTLKPKTDKWACGVCRSASCGSTGARLPLRVHLAPTDSAPSLCSTRPRRYKVLLGGHTHCASCCS